MHGAAAIVKATAGNDLAALEAALARAEEKGVDADDIAKAKARLVDLKAKQAAATDPVEPERPKEPAEEPGVLGKTWSYIKSFPLFAFLWGKSEKQSAGSQLPERNT